MPKLFKAIKQIYDEQGNGFFAYGKEAADLIGNGRLRFVAFSEIFEKIEGAEGESLNH